MSCFTCLWATNGSMRKFFRIPLAFPTYETQLNQNNFTTNSSKAETQKISKHTFIKYYMKTRSCGSVTGNSCYLKMTSNRLKINSIVYPQRETGLEEFETGFKEGCGEGGACYATGGRNITVTLSERLDWLSSNLR